MIPGSFIEAGVAPHLLIFGWLALALIVASIVLWLVGAELTSTSTTIFAATCTLIWLIAMVPYSGEYHHLYRVTGEITDVSSVLVDGSGELAARPVVQLDSLDRPVVVDDPRVLGLDGQDVTLTCRIGWHYQAADTYTCSLYEYSVGATR